MSGSSHPLAQLDPPDLGRALTGFGVNLLYVDVAAAVAFLTGVLGFTAVRADSDFAIVTWTDQMWLLHADGTYAANPLSGLLPEAGPRGAGIELRLYGCDPDTAVERAEALGGVILQRATDKPHGLREAFLLDPGGYCWVPSVPIPAE